MVRKLSSREFPGGPVIRILCFHFMGSIFDQETRIPQAMQYSQKKEEEEKEKLCSSVCW